MGDVLGQHLARCRFPQANAVVCTSGSQDVSFRRPDGTENTVGVSLKHTLEVPVLCAPDANRSVDATARQQRETWMKIRGNNGGIMSHQKSEQSSGFGIP